MSTGQTTAATGCEHVDVLVVGAGISGIGAAWHMTHQRPETSFVVLEAEGSYGGTWLTHNFPGIRSDSDLYTFGYRFKPWVGPPIATAAEIQAYLGAVIDENDLGRHIRYGHRITTANWDSAAQCWTVTAVRTDTGEQLRFTANFLWMCQGYYRHRQGFMPEWPGMADYQGTIAHTEEWDDSLDYAGKQVLVIGSGATAATVVPEMAKTAGHVTMLQRSPTYFIPGRNAVDIADTLRLLQVDENWIHEIVRRQRNFEGAEITRRCFEEPDAVRAELLEGVRALLPPDYDMRHFTPNYLPWRQRIAFVPDGDLFAGICAGKASVVTDEIAHFTPTGVALKSGASIDADVIVAATGFNLLPLGGIDFSIDGVALDFPNSVTWRGMMFTGVPNLIWVFGYFRASWTLRADLIGDFMIRLLNDMAARGATSVVPVLRPHEAGLERLPWIAPENMNSGYLQRGMHLLPRRLDTPEWQHSQDYWLEKDVFPTIDLDDGTLHFAGPKPQALAAE
ncbi:MAG: FAD-containing monooxygenase EthA [Alphaproteobacteria bacterium PA4]|nr:MAG: FAD-containing monooxygenase EthA [Alphaproteobacteria bacterium PA4]